MSSTDGGPPTGPEEGYDPEFSSVRYYHIVRVYGKDNSDVTVTLDDGTTYKGVDCSSCWIDIAVLDGIITESGDGVQYQRTVWRFTYPELDETFDELNNKVRTTSQLRITNPQDRAMWIEVPIAERMVIEHGEGYEYQRIVWQFDNTKKNTIRNTLKRRIYHYEIDDKWLEMPLGADPSDPTVKKKPPRDPRVYIKAIIDSGGTPDKGQFIDVEVVTRWAKNGQIRNLWQGKPVYQTQGTYYVLKHSADPIMRDPLIPQKSGA